MDSAIVDQSVNLMLMGMGTVFVFLTLLVFTVTVMSKVIGAYFQESDAPAIASAPSSSASIGSSQNVPVDPKIVNVIQQAINQHRNKTSKS